MEAALIRLLSALRLSPRQMAQVARQATAIVRDRSVREEEIRQAIDLSANKLKDREARLIDAYVDGVIDEAAYQKRKGLLIEEKVGLDERLNALSADEPTLTARIQKFLELAKSALQSYLSGTPEEKRDLIKIVTSNRIVTENTVEFQPIPALDYLRQREIMSFVTPRGIEPRFAP